MLRVIPLNIVDRKRRLDADDCMVKRVKTSQDQLLCDQIVIDRTQLLVECASLFDQRAIMQRDILQQQEYLKAVRTELESQRRELEIVKQQVALLRTQHKTIAMSCQSQHQSLRTLIQKNVEEVDRFHRLQGKSDEKNDFLY